MLAKVLTAAASGLLAASVGVGAAGAAGGPGDDRYRSVPPAPSGVPTASTTGFGGGAPAAGGISVAVPEVPPLRALPGLCRAFLRTPGGEGHGPVSGYPADLRVLMGATGGTVASTGSWCRTFLALGGHRGRDRAGDSGRGRRR